MDSTTEPKALSPKLEKSICHSREIEMIHQEGKYCIPVKSLIPSFTEHVLLKWRWMGGKTHS